MEEYVGNNPDKLVEATTIRLQIANQFNLVVTPDKGFEDTPQPKTKIGISDTNGLWLQMLGCCEHCHQPLLVQFWLSNYLPAHPCLMETSITCRACRRTQIKKINYYVEEVDNIHKIST